jgi:hypothetical protein
MQDERLRVTLGIVVFAALLTLGIGLFGPEAARVEVPDASTFAPSFGGRDDPLGVLGAIARSRGVDLPRAIAKSADDADPPRAARP